MAAGAGYNIPISVSASAALNSGGSFNAGDVYFDFGSGSQAGAPVYQDTPVDQTPTATSAAAEGNANAQSATSGSGSAGGSGSGISSAEIALVVFGLVAAGLAGYLLIKNRPA